MCSLYSQQEHRPSYSEQKQHKHKVYANKSKTRKKELRSQHASMEYKLCLICNLILYSCYLPNDFNILKSISHNNSLNVIRVCGLTKHAVEAAQLFIKGIVYPEINPQAIQDVGNFSSVERVKMIFSWNM